MGLAYLDRVPRGSCKARASRAACVVLAAAALAPLPAAAQQQAPVLIGAEILDAATVRNAADMDFGRIIASSSLGTVVMTPSASPTCATTGGIIRTGPCKAAQFTGLALYQADLRVQRPTGDRIDLTGPGGATMRVQDFTFGSTGATVSLTPNGANPHRFRVDAADGAFLFYVGGTLRVGANQAPGIYNGTFEIRITYN